MSEKREIISFLCMILVVLIWSGSFIFIRLGLRELAPSVLALARFAIASPPLVAYTLLARKRGMRTGFNWRTHSLLFLALGLTLEELNSWFTRLDTVFRYCISTDLDIFSTLADGVPLTEEQWERLYVAIAPQPPDTTGFKKHHHTRNKTRRTHGRRALTPMRRHHHHRAVTRHQPHLNVVKLK